MAVTKGYLIKQVIKMFLDLKNLISKTKTNLKVYLQRGKHTTQIKILPYTCIYCRYKELTYNIFCDVLDI